MKSGSLLAIPSLVLAACGGGDSTGSSSDIPVPSSLAVAAGDQQSAQSGAAVATPPAVVVKDHSGHPIAGVAVTFAVDAGDGSVSGANASTGADGVARAGSWVLGSGTNRLKASSGSLPPVYFTATGSGPTVLAQGSVPATGGTVTVSRPGDPLDGLALKLPAGAYSTATSWTIAADSSIHPTLPTGFTLAATPLVVTNGKGFADSVMTLKVPMNVGDDQALAPFYYDPASGRLEGIPMVDRTTTYSTLATRHFSNDQLANVPHVASLRATGGAASSAFGTVIIVWVKTPVTNLVGTFSTSFRPGIDDWEFVNYGDYASPGGDCEGMSITAMYYHYFIKNAGVGSTGLFHAYDQSLANQWDNVQGIRFAGSVQADYAAHWAPGVSQIATLAKQAIASGVPARDWTATWIALTIKLTGVPVLIALLAPTDGHAVVAYAVTSSGTQVDVSFADPNHPGLARTMTFISGVLTPVQASVNIKEPDISFNRAYALGVSAEVPLGQLDTRWAEFKQQHAGADRYPTSYTFAYLNYMSGQYEPAPAVIRTSNPTFTPAVLCPSCPKKYPNSSPDLMIAQIWDAAGANQVNNDIGQLTLTAGSTDYVLVGMPLSPFGDPMFPTGFLDSKKISVVYHPFSIQPKTVTGSVNTRYTFTILDNGLFAPGSVYNLSLREGTTPSPVTATTDNTIDFMMDHPGTFVIKVVLLDADQHTVAIDSATITINPPGPAWRLTSIVNNGEGEITTGCSATTLDHIHAIRSRMTQLQGNASDGLIFTDPWKQAGRQSEAYLQVAPPGQGGAATGRVAGWYYFTLGGLVGSILPTSFNMRTKAGDVFQAENETLTGLRPLEASLNGFPQAGNNLTGFMFMQYTDGTSTCLFNGNYVITATLVAGIY